MNANVYNPNKNYKEGMRKSVANGVIWSAVDKLSFQGVSFLLTMILARLVLPSEYGLIAMLNIFMAIAQSFVDSGFGNALIQKKDRNDVDFSTVFYFNVVISVVLYGLMFISAPYIADFYNQPQLTEITRWISLNLVFVSLSLVQRTILSIDLDFKKQAKISLFSIVTSGIVAIYMAYKGYGVWALVVQSLGSNLLSSILLWSTTKWKPLLCFSIDSFKKLFAFGSKLLISGILNTLYLNSYSLVIGKFYSVSDVGYYNRSYTISQLPSLYIVGIVARAMYPVQCEHQDDEKWLSETFIKYLKMTCFVVFPLMALLAAIAKPLVLILLTEKWLPAAALISILAIAYIIIPIMSLNDQMLYVRGRSDLALKAQVIKKIVAILILAVTLPFGVKVLSMGVVLFNVFDVLLTISFSKKVISTGYLVQFRALAPILSVVTVAGVVSYLLQMMTNNVWSALCIGIISYLFIFVIGCIIIKPEELTYLKRLLKR